MRNGKTSFEATLYYVSAETAMFLLAVIVDKLKTLPDEFDRDPTEVSSVAIHDFYLKLQHLSFITT